MSLGASSYGCDQCASPNLTSSAYESKHVATNCTPVVLPEQRRLAPARTRTIDDDARYANWAFRNRCPSRQFSHTKLDQ